MDICCVLTGNYTVYISRVHNSYYRTRPVVAGLHIARTNSNVLENTYRNVHIIEIGEFEFGLTEWLEYESFPDYSIYDVKQEVVTVPFKITIVDFSAYCGSRSSVNLSQFIWKHVCTFGDKMYAKVCACLNALTVP